MSVFPTESNISMVGVGLIGRTTSGAGKSSRLDAATVRALCSVYSTSEVDTLLAGKANSSHTHAWSDITSGKPTTLAGYGITDAITSAAVAAGYQPLDGDLTAIAALTTTSFGRSLLTQADAAAVRTTIGAGTSSFDGAFSSLTGKPTTISGYGITNAYTKTEVDNLVAGLLDFKGNQDCSANPNYPAGLKGDSYYVSVAGKIGGASGVTVAVGDLIVCSADNAGGTQASVGASWFVLEKNLDGALVSSNNLSDLANAATARSNLGLGTLATQSGTFSGTSSGTNTGDQNTFLNIAVSGQSTVVADQTGDTLTLVAGTNITITTDATTDTITIASSSSGIGGTLGSTANVVPRASGTGGSTAQASAIVIDDLYTASPNATVNYVCMGPTGGTTNVGLALRPKGTGPLTAHVPDSTTTGGNARGANSIDLQTLRDAASQVASASQSVVIGAYCTASGTQRNTAIGHRSAATGYEGCVAIGMGATASSGYSTAIGFTVTSSIDYAFATGGSAVADRWGMKSHAAGTFATAGDCQKVEFVLRAKTTNNTPTTLFLNQTSNRLTIPSGKVLTCKVMVHGIKSDGSAVAVYRRLVTIKNVGGTTTLVNLQTLGSDYEDNAATDIAITADDTNDALQINVTGITGETWRWQGIVTVAGEMAYGV